MDIKLVALFVYNIYGNIIEAVAPFGLDGLYSTLNGYKRTVFGCENIGNCLFNIFKFDFLMTCDLCCCALGNLLASIVGADYALNSDNVTLLYLC